MRRLVPEGSRSEWRDATGSIELAEVHPHLEWFGLPITHIESSTQARVAFITRLAEGLVPNEHTVLQEGDLLHMIIETARVAEVEAILAAEPLEHP
jgi:trk system potassium uptake protein TrkA